MEKREAETHTMHVTEVQGKIASGRGLDIHHAIGVACREDLGNKHQVCGASWGKALKTLQMSLALM